MRTRAAVLWGLGQPWKVEDIESTGRQNLCDLGGSAFMRGQITEGTVVRAGTQAGDTVVVVGIGGIGINAVQGAWMAGANELPGKGGTMVVTGVAPITQTEASVNLFALAMWQNGTNVHGVIVFD